MWRVVAYPHLPGYFWQQLSESERVYCVTKAYFSTVTCSVSHWTEVASVFGFLSKLAISSTSFEMRCVFFQHPGRPWPSLPPFCRTQFLAVERRKSNGLAWIERKESSGKSGRQRKHRWRVQEDVSEACLRTCFFVTKHCQQFFNCHVTHRIVTQQRSFCVTMRNVCDLLKAVCLLPSGGRADTRSHRWTCIVTLWYRRSTGSALSCPWWGFSEKSSMRTEISLCITTFQWDTDSQQLCCFHCYGYA